MESAGLGDVKLSVAYGILKKENVQLSFFGGISIPTGSAYKTGKANDPMYSNKRLPYAMQTGSGTFDLMPAINYLYQNNNLACSFQLSSTLHPWYNSLGYRYGNEATINAWFSYKWSSFMSSSIRTEASASDKILGYDQDVFYYNEPSANPQNYGGKKIIAYAGCVFQTKKGCLKNHRLGIEYGLPLLQSVNGIQMKLSQTINASWALNF
jgi:hypothetical protein